MYSIHPSADKMKKTFIIELDTDKTLDEAIFYALCGLDHCRDKSLITGVVRLKIARAKLDVAIDALNKEVDSWMNNKDK